MKTDLKPIRLSTASSDLFNPHPYLIWDRSFNGGPIREFLPPYSLVAYLHINSAIDMYYMGVKSDNTICCKILDQALFDRLIRDVHAIARKSFFTRMRFKLLLWIASNQLLKKE